MARDARGAFCGQTNSLTFTCSHMRPKFGAAWPAFHSSFCFVRRFHRLHTHPSRFKTNAGHLTLFHRPIIPLEKMFAAKGEKVFLAREMEIFEFTRNSLFGLTGFSLSEGPLEKFQSCMHARRVLRAGQSCQKSQQANKSALERSHEMPMFCCCAAARVFEQRFLYISFVTGAEARAGTSLSKTLGKCRSAPLLM